MPPSCPPLEQQRPLLGAEHSWSSNKALFPRLTDSEQDRRIVLVRGSGSPRMGWGHRMSPH